MDSLVDMYFVEPRNIETAVNAIQQQATTDKSEPILLSLQEHYDEHPDGIFSSRKNDSIRTPTGRLLIHTPGVCYFVSLQLVLIEL